MAQGGQSLPIRITGTFAHLTNVSLPMVMNPDPRPGRWLLPLVILGMMTFTYVFVQNLPASDAAAQDIGANGVEAQNTTTTIAPDAATTTTVPAAVLSPETQDYLNQVATAETELLAFQAEMADINGRWDSDPRTIEYSDGEALLTDLAARIAAWATNLGAVVPPVALTEAHGVLTATAQASAESAADVLTGFTGPDRDPRITALGEFDVAVTAFTAAADDVELRATTTGA